MAENENNQNVEKLQSEKIIDQAGETLDSVKGIVAANLRDDTPIVGDDNDVANKFKVLPMQKINTLIISELRDNGRNLGQGF